MGFGQVSEATRRVMQANRGRDTGPELRLRRALWAAGLRGYRKNRRGLPGTPDVAYGRAKLAVFVHGCFWHGCPHCGRYRAPKTNAEFWAEKLRRNGERDLRTFAALETLGWRSLVIWECEMKGEERLASVVASVTAALAHPLG